MVGAPDSSKDKKYFDYYEYYYVFYFYSFFLFSKLLEVMAGVPNSFEWQAVVKYKETIRFPKKLF